MTRDPAQPPRRRRDRGDRGAALVEFALVLPILAMLVVGLFSSAMLYDGKMQLTHATREGARYGATVPEEQTFASGTWASNVRDLVLQREGGNLTGADVCVALVQGSPAVPLSAAHTTEAGGGACFDDTASGVVGRRVQVSTRRTMTFEAVAFTRDVTLTSNAAAHHESNG